MTITSRLIDVAGGRNKVRVYEGGDGPPLFYLHGAGGLMREDRVLAALSRHYRVHAPLLPGYEDSVGEERLRDMLDITLHGYDVMQALGLSKPLVVGHSMGGMIAAEMAAIAPNEIERLALIAPAGLWLPDHPIVDIFALLPQEFPHYLFHDVEAGVKLMTPGGDMNDVKFLAEFMIANARRLGTAGKMLFPIPERGLSERLYRIKARTLIVWGENDRLIPPLYAQAFVKGIAGARLTTIAQAGHLVGHEKPEALVEALRTLN